MVPTALSAKVPRAALVAAVLAVVAGLFAGGEATRRTAVTQACTRALAQLAPLAGLRDETGARVGEPLVVAVLQEGGSPWIQDAAQDAVEASEDFRVGDSRHLLRVEAVETPGLIAIQLRLWRQGWDLRSPDLALGRVAPWVAVLAAAFGAVLAAWVRNVGVGVLGAGVLAQGLLAALPWPATAIAPLSWLDQLRTGPVLASLSRATLSTWVTPVAAAVLALCLVLVAFDHRRSRDRESSVDLGRVGLLAAMLATGGIAWLEAALRAGLWASMHALPGMFAALALSTAWALAAAAARARGSA